MALDQLLGAFERDVEAEVRAIIAGAEAEGARVTAEAARERAERVATAMRVFAGERRAASERELAAAVRHARADTLAARAAMLERVREALDAELVARAAIPAVAAELERAARDCAGAEPAVLHATPTGPVLELASGTRVDAALGSLAQRRWPALACLALENVP